MGFNISNQEHEYKRIRKAFYQLERFGEYELNCFLRWIVLRKFIYDEGIRQHVYHIDGDVIFNGTPEEISQDTAGKTFVLQGCPAFVSIAEHEWFEYYFESLHKFHEDIEGYSRKAWQERPGWESSHQTLWAGGRFRETITSDQDLFSHLIHTGRTIQTPPAEFAKELNLYYMENPLYLSSHAETQIGQGNRLQFKEIAGKYYVNGKKIALWHFQSNFTQHLQLAWHLKRIHYPFRYPNLLESNLLTRNFGYLILKMFPETNRAGFYDKLIALNDQPADQSFRMQDIFNNRRFWKKDVFAD